MSETPAQRWRRILESDPVLKLVAVGTALAAAAVFAYLGYVRPPQSHIWGDEGTYLAMTASLARDGDLTFEEPDRTWAIERGSDKGVAVILQRAGDRITYSKPLLYPLVAAVPYKLFGEPGLVLVNALALAMGLAFVALVLGRAGRGGHLWLTWAAFAGCATVVPYVAWRMSEALQVGLAMGGLALVLGPLRDRSDASDDSDAAPKGRFDHLLESPLAPWLGGLLLGLLISMRSSNAVLAAGAVVACLAMRRYRYAGRVAVGTLAGVVLVLVATLVGLGVANPYLAERSSFNAEIGYPVAPDHPAAERFDERPATHRAHLEVSKLTAWSAFYFVAGRHTGLLAYFPFALVLAYWLLRHPDRVGLSMLAAVGALAAFYLVYMPQNYFGGATFLGNRYFLVAYPALVLAIRRLPSPTLLVGTVVVGLLAGGSAVASVRQTRGIDASSQSHTAAGVFGLLPYESTAREIEGQKVRFWSNDYVRFINALADVQRRRFILHEGRPSAEIMIATRLPRERFFFLVRIGNERGAFDWKDWARSGWIPLEGNRRKRQGLISLRPATPWRSHTFAFQNDESYKVYVLQLEIHPIRPENRPERTPIEAEVYYIGDPEVLASHSANVVADKLPGRGLAGGRRMVRLRVRNTSPVAWDPNGVLPVIVGCRIWQPDAELSDAMPDVQRFDLPDIVPPGESVDLELPVRLPEEPGSYRLDVDLALHPLYWFSQRRNKPLASGRIEVVESRDAAAETD